MMENRFDPERAAGGLTRRNDTVEFYLRIRGIIDPDITALDFGAGRGTTTEKQTLGYGARLARLKGAVRKLVGVDLDPIVLQNQGLDEAYQISTGESLPFGANTFDLIYSDWVLEHIEETYASSSR